MCSSVGCMKVGPKANLALDGIDVVLGPISPIVGLLHALLFAWQSFYDNGSGPRL